MARGQFPPADARAKTRPPSASRPGKRKVIRPARERTGPLARIEYALVWATLRFFGLLPFRLAFRIGEWVGRVWYWADPWHRRVGLINLALAFPHKSRSDRRRILKDSFVNLGRLLAEFCHLSSLTPENIAARVRFEDEDRSPALVRQYRDTGALALTGHFGNWELLAYAHGCYGFPIHIIHRRLHNPLIEDLISRERERCGTKIIRKTSAGIEVFRAIRQKAFIVAALDQNASGRMGAFVPFFSQLASTSTGLAGLALSSGVPVIPIFLVRQNGTWHHRIVLLPPVEPVRTGDPEDDLRQTTAKFTRVFQHMVERYPDHWLWIHKRWKRRPDGEARIY